MEHENMVQEEEKSGGLDPWLKKVIIIFAILFAVSLPCACLLGYRTQWIFWKLGLF